MSSARFERWPWRDFGGSTMTHQRALAESIYAVSLAHAVMGGRADEFGAAARAMLLPTSAIYQRRPGDWAV